MLLQPLMEKLTLLHLPAFRKGTIACFKTYSDVYLCLSSYTN